MDKLTNRIKRKTAAIEPWNYDNGLKWYAEANSEARQLAKQYSISIKRAAAIIAVLSPGTSWERNIIDARAICEVGSDAIVTTYKANKEKALAILASSDDTFHNHVRGNKVRSFYDNIVAPDTSVAVTLDRHMLRFILRTNDDKELNRVFRSSNNYASIAERIRRRAYRLNIRPCQLQAALWLQVRPSNGGN